MKWYVYLLVIAALIFLMLYSLINYHRHYPSLDTFYNEPGKYAGARAENCGMMVDKTNDGFILRAGVNKILVRYNQTSLRYPLLGTVCVLGTYNDGFIHAEAVRLNDFIFVKYFISLLAFFYVVFVFFREWKITIRGFKPRGK